MTGCCCPPRGTDPEEYRECPRSGTPGSPVDVSTVKALLTERALQRLFVGPHRFCPEPSCEVVYFDDSGHVFTAADIRAGVWQKQPFGARMICYCFGENEADMLREPGPSQAAERVRAHIAAGRCACELRNPKGTCCLADVIAAVKRVEASRDELSHR
jgi:hypothetical protein